MINLYFIICSIFLKTEYTFIVLMTNSSDAPKLRDTQYQFANGIYIGIKKYFGFA